MYVPHNVSFGDIAYFASGREGLRNANLGGDTSGAIAGSHRMSAANRVVLYEITMFLSAEDGVL